MQVAQQLYESGYITYMRTDSVNLSDLALGMAAKEIEAQYGSEYLHTRRYHTKTKGAQEAHEAIRPTDLGQPSLSIESAARRLYELIWKRTIASQMADAELEKTEINISATTASGKVLDEHFGCSGEVVKFDGFLKVYRESKDDETAEPEVAMLPRLPEGTRLNLEQVEAAEHYTQPPTRYTEASLVKKLEDLGIGRPSTYAPTISTILKREYVMKEDREAAQHECLLMTLQDDQVVRSTRIEKGHAEKNKLLPTDIGCVVNSFLMEHFSDIMDYNFTATVEKNFDEIADGKQQWREVIDHFYVPFHKNIQQTQQNSQRTTGSRLLGVDPASGKNVYAKIGRYGTLVQIGDTGSDEKPRFASMKKGQSIETISLDEALALFALPRNIGKFEDEDVVISIGKFGPYVRCGNKFYSLGKNDDPYEVNLERAIEIIKVKREAERQKEELRKIYPLQVGMHEGEPITANIGKFGPYLSYKGENFRLADSIDPQTMSVEQALAIIEKAAKRKTRRK